MTRNVYKDKEIVWFYWIIIGGFSIGLLLAAFNKDLVFLLFFFFTILGFLYLSFPTTAILLSNGDIRFRYPIRVSTVSRHNLRKVKILGGYDYRAHLVIATRSLFPISYRCRRFDHAPELAQHILQLIEQAPQAEVTPEAMKLLKQVAGGNINSLKEEKV